MEDEDLVLREGEYTAEFTGPLTKEQYEDLTEDESSGSCPKCGGTGRYRDPQIWGTMPGSYICDHCEGSGKSA